MKFSSRIKMAVAALALAASSAFAQVYPISNPSYTPTAVVAPTTYTTTGDYTFAVSGISTATIRISGTCTGLTAAPQGTNDGTNWTTLQAIPVAGGANVTTFSAVGFWRINTSGFTRSRVHITALSASCTVAMAGTNTPGTVYLQNPQTVTGPVSIQDSTATYYLPSMDAVARKGFVQLTDGTSAAGVTAASTAPVAATPALVVAQSPNASDPCATAGIAKSSAVISQGASATTKVVDVSGSKVIYVCGFTATASGTSPTFTWTGGTHGSADCDTGAAVLSGAMVPSATVGVVSYGGGGSTVFATPASKQLCLTTAASTSVMGVLTYVQQ